MNSRIARREKKTETRKHEEEAEDQHLAPGQGLQKGEGARSTERRTKETAEDAEGGPPLGKAEPRKDSKDRKVPISLGPVYLPLVPSSMNATKSAGQHWESSPRIEKSFQIHDGSLHRYIDTTMEKRLASWKERRSRFGDVDVHKRYQFGKVFSPFQALTTPEMRRVVFLQDLPMSSRMRKRGVSCTTDTDLQDLPLTFTELDTRKDDTNREKEKPANQIKTPLFPPIVRATKSNMK